MTTLAEYFKQLMTADTGAGGVATLLTGGIYTYEETGRLGISRLTTPEVWDDTTNKLRPCAIVKMGAQVPNRWLVDDDEQKASWTQTVEVFVYDDGDGDTAVLDAVAARLFVLFHGVRVNTWMTHWAFRVVGEREVALNHALMTRVDFTVNGVQ